MSLLLLTVGMCYLIAIVLGVKESITKRRKIKKAIAVNSEVRHNQLIKRRNRPQIMQKVQRTNS